MRRDDAAILPDRHGRRRTRRRQVQGRAREAELEEVVGDVRRHARRVRHGPRQVRDETGAGVDVNKLCLLVADLATQKL